MCFKLAFNTDDLVKSSSGRSFVDCCDCCFDDRCVLHVHARDFHGIHVHVPVHHVHSSLRDDSLRFASLLFRIKLLNLLLTLLLAYCDSTIELCVAGQKESFLIALISLRS